MISTQSELYAGGECGVLVLADSSSMKKYRGLLEIAERMGLSGLLTSDAEESTVLPALGVKTMCLVADNSRLNDAIGLAKKKACDALCLISPALPDTAAALQTISELRLPRLLLTGSSSDDVAAMYAFNARSAGPVAMRVFPVQAQGACLVSESTGLVIETICLFAVRSLGSVLARTHDCGRFAA